MPRSPSRPQLTWRYEMARSLAFAAQLTDNFAGDFSGARQFLRRKGNCPYYRMAAAAISFTQGRQVVSARSQAPGIGTDRDFRTVAGKAQSHAVRSLREEVIRNEFVVSLKAIRAHIKKYGAVGTLGAFTDNVD